MSFNQFAVSSGLLFGVAFVIFSQIADDLPSGGSTNPGPTSTVETAFTRDGRPATTAEMKTFEALLRLERRAKQRSRINGDVSLYPEVYYNDPTVDQVVEIHQILEDAGAEAEKVLSGIAPDKAGEPSGLLTANIAIVLRKQENQAEWSDEQVTAAVERRKTSTTDKPAGTNPYPEKYGEHNVGTPHYVFDGLVLGDQAEFKLAYEPPRKAALILTYTLTRVDSRWYISGERGEYRPNP